MGKIYLTARAPLKAAKTTGALSQLLAYQNLRRTGARGASRARLRRSNAAMGLPLRAGVHTGEIEVRGQDVGGIAVHAAPRVMAQSGANEVLVSRVVTDLVAGAGLKFTERGTFELRGIPGQWELFAAVP
jgi:class 3 adenylate cyclase